MITLRNHLNISLEVGVLCLLLSPLFTGKFLSICFPFPPVLFEQVDLIVHLHALSPISSHSSFFPGSAAFDAAYLTYRADESDFDLTGTHYSTAVVNKVSISFLDRYLFLQRLTNRRPKMHHHKKDQGAESTIDSG